MGEAGVGSHSAMTHGPGGTLTVRIHHRRKEEEDRDLTLGFTLATGLYVVGLTVIWIPSFIVSLY